MCTSVIIVNCRHLCKFYHVYNGLPQSLDWTSELDWWTGLVDWTYGLTLKLILCFVTTRGAVWNPVAFSLSILVQLTYYINSEGLRIQHVLLPCVKLLTSVKVLGLKMVFACSLQTNCSVVIIHNSTVVLECATVSKSSTSSFTYLDI